MKSPAFQFYANDWLSSTKIALMTPAEEGAYIHLLCHAWNDPNHSVPDDDQQLAALSRLGEGWFKGGAEKVRACFKAHPSIPGRLVNERMLKEAQKQAEWREKSRLGGISSAAARASAAKGGSRVVENGCDLVPTNGQPTVNSSSSSSSSSSISNKCTPEEENSQALALYAKYPRKKSRDKALPAIRKALRKYGFDLLMERTTKFAQRCVGMETTYIPYPAKWFNAGGFDDDDLKDGGSERPKLPTKTSLSQDEMAALLDPKFG